MRHALGQKKFKLIADLLCVKFEAEISSQIFSRVGITNRPAIRASAVPLDTYIIRRI